VIQPTSISLTIKSNPKHDPSGYMAIPVYLSGEEKLQIDHPLRMISHLAYQTDQDNVRYFSHIIIGPVKKSPIWSMIGKFQEHIYSQIGELKNEH